MTPRLPWSHCELTLLTEGVEALDAYVARYLPQLVLATVTIPEWSGAVVCSELQLLP